MTENSKPVGAAWVCVIKGGRTYKSIYILARCGPPNELCAIGEKEAKGSRWLCLSCESDLIYEPGKLMCGKCDTYIPVRAEG